MANSAAARYMFIFELFILFLQFNCNSKPHIKNKAYNSLINWNCSNKLDEALLRIEFISNTASTEIIAVNYQYEECKKCDLISFTDLQPSSNYISEKVIDSFYSYKFQVINKSSNEIICDTFTYKNFKECGVYSFTVSKSDKTCSITLLDDSEIKNSNSYIYVAFSVAIVLILISNASVKLYNNYENKRKISQILETPPNTADNINMDLSTNKDEKKAKASKENPKASTRIHSLDTFRGLSLVIMIFVNYGSGQFKSMQHKPWNGITIADLVFPWFLWIVGMSIAISTHSLLKKPESSKLKVFLKCLIRFVKMFGIGLMLNSRFGVFLVKLRIMGVLQRIAISYIFVALFEILFYSKIKVPDETKTFWQKFKRFTYQVTCAWKNWCVMLLLVIVWFLITFLVEVPGCPKGYLGPGGLEDSSKYFNCTGGVAGYVDKLILGRSHMYAFPTCMKIYKTTEPFDPEGIMGAFNSILLTFLGVQAGRILILYQNNFERIGYWFLWAVLTFIAYGSLCSFSLESGWIPVNKNLWTITYTLLMASTSYVILILLFIVIDVKKWWDGNPFIYPGMNSIVIYVCHSFFATTLPVQWLVANTHLAQIFMDLWGAVFWTLFAGYLYFKKVFINL